MEMEDLKNVYIYNDEALKQYCKLGVSNPELLRKFKPIKSKSFLAVIDLYQVRTGDVRDDDELIKLFICKYLEERGVVPTNIDAFESFVFNFTMSCEHTTLFSLPTVSAGDEIANKVLIKNIQEIMNEENKAA
jgi:hypothetical protein